MVGSEPLMSPDERWPELPWREWRSTVATLHMWVQIVGKVRMALAPPLNHWWHVPLYVSARGLTTSPIPYRSRLFEVEFDFVEHRLQVGDSDGRVFTMALEARSVASFYREFMDGLRALGIDVRISTRPVEVADSIPFETDEQHASYDPGHARLLWRGLAQADRVMKEFQGGFVGKASPVHLFWGSFDLAASRYSGRSAPLHPGGAPNCPTWVMEEAYSREEHAVGWWPSSDEPGPAFYAYMYPEPEGFSSAPIHPADASFDPRLGEFILPYDAARRAADPDAAVREFFESTYAAGADLGGWDRSILEPAIAPGRPPDRPWSVIDPVGGSRRRAAPPSVGAAPNDRPHRHGSRHDRALRSDVAPGREQEPSA
jgi:Family of unknown function (DUF5996)